MDSDWPLANSVVRRFDLDPMNHNASSVGCNLKVEVSSGMEWITEEWLSGVKGGEKCNGTY
jgi:hypothetical protein